MSLHHRHHRPIQLLLVLLIISTVHSQPTTNSDQQPLSGFTKGFNPTTAIVIVAVMSAFFFLGFFYIYFHKRSSGSSERHSNSIETMLASRSTREQATKGLDPAVIDSFPTTMYSNVKGMKMGNTTLECAVCISEFADHETLTLLPKCNHAFHPYCIGTWLSSHTTCPVCRINLAAVSSTSSPDHDSTPEHVAVTVDNDIAEELRRMGSIRGRVLRTWRSRSERPGAGARMGQFWAEEERERFTLRLPENVRREFVTGVKPLPLTSVRVESSRMGYRGEDSVGLRKWDRAAKSDRWAFLGRASSVRSSSKAGDTEGGGSSRGKVLAAVMGPLDCIGGGGVGDDDKSTVALMKT